MHRLTEKGKQFLWTEECEKAFNELKHVLTSAPILAFPTPTDKYILDTDASSDSLGAVLSQVQGGEEKVIAYFSKSFSKPERRYCVTRKELYAIVASVKHFHHYLYGANFLVRTDHSALRWLLTFKHPEGQVARWLEVLGTYHYEVEYRPGTKHGNADALSRRPCIDCRHCLRLEEKEASNQIGESELNSVNFNCEGPCPETAPVTHFSRVITRSQAKESHPVSEQRVTGTANEAECKGAVAKARADEPSITEDSNAKKGQDVTTKTVPEGQNGREEGSDGPEIDQWSVNDIKRAQREDLDIRQIVDWKLISQSKPDWTQLSSESRAVKTYWGLWDVLVLKDGVLYRRWESLSGDESVLKLVVPRGLRKEIMSQLHDNSGHLGVKKTQKRVQDRFYWAGYHKDIERWCRQCEKCASRKGPVRAHKAHMKTYIVGVPMERVAMDILGPLPVTDRGNKYILCIADYFTKWTEAFPLPNQEAETVARVFVEQFVTRFGVPLQLHTDQGRNFESSLFKEVAALLGIGKTRTTAFHPQSDGMVERFNRTLEAMLSTVVSDNQQDWDLWLPHMTMAYRSSIHESTQETPNVMMLGREMNLPIDLMVPPSPGEEFSSINYVDELRSKFRKVHDIARVAAKKASERQKRTYDLSSNTKTYQVGDQVWLYTPAKKKGLSPKLQRFWDGPFTVLHRLSDVTYRIRKSAQSKPKIVHHDRLKPFESA